MRIVTIERFGELNATNDEEHRGYTYKGDGWLFRFTISSPQHFLSAELPRLVEVLDIDSRQIMQLILSGPPASGYYEVRLLISFEEPPEERQVDQLRLRAAAVPPDDYPHDVMQNVFLDILETATMAQKKKFAKALQKEKHHATTANQNK